MTNTTTETRRRLAQDTVVRHDGAFFWLMNRREDGWASRGIPYNSLIEITQDWAVTIGARGRDITGEYTEIKAVRS